MNRILTESSKSLGKTTFPMKIILGEKLSYGKMSGTKVPCGKYPCYCFLLLKPETSSKDYEYYKNCLLTNERNEKYK